MITGFRHIGIVVSNLRESLVFYTDILGYEIFKEMDEEGSFIDKILGIKGVNVKTFKLKHKFGPMIELLDFSHPLPIINKHTIHDQGITHIAFTVKNIEKMYLDLCAAGVPFISSPQVNVDGSCKVAFCKAPEGTIIEIVQVLQ